MSYLVATNGLITGRVEAALDWVSDYSRGFTCAVRNHVRWTWCHISPVLIANIVVEHILMLIKTAGRKEASVVISVNSNGRESEGSGGAFGWTLGPVSPVWNRWLVFLLHLDLGSAPVPSTKGRQVQPPTNGSLSARVWIEKTAKNTTIPALR